MANGNNNEWINWIAIARDDLKPIGAVGFIGNRVAAVIAFYNDADVNEDGKVSLSEWVAFHITPLSLRGIAVTEVAMAARNTPTVIQRDPSFYQEANRMYTTFAAGLVNQGICEAYFTTGVKLAGSSVMSQIGIGMVKQFVVRRGLETAVRKAFHAATDQRRE